MGAWDYELARELRGLGQGAGRTEILEGTVVSVSPLTVSLFGGEVMAPPAPLQTLFCGFTGTRTADIWSWSPGSPGTGCAAAGWARLLWFWAGFPNRMKRWM